MEYKNLIPSVKEWLAGQRQNYIDDLIDAIRTYIITTLMIDELLPEEE